MKPKILIIGPPQSGKSTLISKLIEYYSKKQISIYGFLTPEVREGSRRIGFDVEEISSKDRDKLARVDSTNSEYRLGRYSVYIKRFDAIISKLEKVQIQEEDMIVIDEIGKMELFSTKFQDYIKKIFLLKVPIIATIGLTVNHPIKEYLLHLPDVNLFNLNHDSFQIIYQSILSII
jgi:nucleoside-triphosphatase